MRAEFADAMIALYETHKDSVFITLDLGYMALEGVQRTYGARFINAGVAEQNAVSLAAGLAHEGQLPWIYSMAAFSVLRPYAQIRDNVCLQQLPVKLVGNGGGYGYGIMGPTHHALEDVAALRALPHMKIYVPLVAADIPEVICLMAADPMPNYLRLNAPATLPNPPPPFAPWRCIKQGGPSVLIAMGPVVQGLFELDPALLDELEIWSVGSFPLQDLPSPLATSIQNAPHVIVMEEHQSAGGLGEALSHHLLTAGIIPQRVTTLHAAGYPSGRYGSQRWHQAESGLRGPSLAARLRELLCG